MRSNCFCPVSDMLIPRQAAAASQQSLGDVPRVLPARPPASSVHFHGVKPPTAGTVQDVIPRTVRTTLMCCKGTILMGKKNPCMTLACLALGFQRPRQGRGFAEHGHLSANLGKKSFKTLVKNQLDRPCARKQSWLLLPDMRVRHVCVVDAARRSGGCSGSATWAVDMRDGTKYLEASPLERLSIRLPQDDADT